MKANLLIISLAALMLSSCDALNEKNESKSFIVVNNMKAINRDTMYLDGSMYEVMVYQMNGYKTLKTNDIDKIDANGGTSQKIELLKNCSRLKLSFRFLPKESPFYDIIENRRKIISYTWYVNSDKVTSIDINDEILGGNKFIFKTSSQH